MAPLPRKRPRQFVSSYSFERVAVLGRIILLLSPGLHSWHAPPTTVWVLWAAWLYNVTVYTCEPAHQRSLFSESDTFFAV